VCVWAYWAHGSPPTIIGRGIEVREFSGLSSIPFFAVACSPGGRLLAYLGERGIDVWDLRAAGNDHAGNLVQHIPSKPCRTLSFTRDNSALVAVEFDGGVTIRRIDPSSEASRRFGHRAGLVSHSPLEILSDLLRYCSMRLRRHWPISSTNVIQAIISPPTI
jgi:hypothetical protein